MNLIIVITFLEVALVANVLLLDVLKEIWEEWKIDRFCKVLEQG